MQQYLIKLYYLDGKDINVILNEDEVSSFMEHVQQNKPYWTENKETAFWTPQDQIRYLNIVKYDPSKIPASPKPQEEEKEVKEEKKDTKK